MVTCWCHFGAIVPPFGTKSTVECQHHFYYYIRCLVTPRLVSSMRNDLFASQKMSTHLSKSQPISAKSTHLSKVNPSQQSQPISAKSTHLSKVNPSQQSPQQSQHILAKSTHLSKVNPSWQCKPISAKLTHLGKVNPSSNLRACFCCVFWKYGASVSTPPICEQLPNMFLEQYGASASILELVSRMFTCFLLKSIVLLSPNLEFVSRFFNLLREVWCFCVQPCVS